MSHAGVVVLVVVLLAATAFGLYRRRTDGRLEESMPIAGAALSASSSPADSTTPDSTTPDSTTPDSTTGTRDRLTSEELGAGLGPRTTLVQFSSVFCAPCRAARTLLADVAGSVDGVVYVDVDAESHLDLVRRHSVLRTPTVFVLDGEGRVVRRGVGLPRKSEVFAALGEAIP